MSDQGQRQLPSGLAGGRLEGISVPDLLCGLSRTGKTGVLSVTHDETTKRVYIDRGNIVFATSSDPDDRLGETLLCEDLITLDQLERAASRRGTGKRLGTILVEIAAITPQDLVNGVMQQVKGIIVSLFPVENGDYRFDSGDLPTEELITVTMKMEELLLNGIRQVRSFSRVRRSVGPPRTRYRLTDQWEQISDGLGLNEAERTLLRHLDASGRTVDELCNEVFLSNFEVYQSLWAFKVLGAIQETERAANAPESVGLEGTLDAGGIVPILVQLCHEGETGVLYMSKTTVDRAIHIREGRCIFATSSNIDDGLIAHLLRRGVISLRDREETARRLLSNKRVGTILREMGVIDEDDLGDMVREQLREIVLDTFQWETGEFAFVPGELPTIEDITLQTSVEDIVLAGTGRITKWSRVRQGAGGLDAKLVLDNDYLRILDRMNVGQEEWEVVAALRSTKTVAEVCRQSSLGDFRTCQILWAFRLLGVAAMRLADDPVADEVEAVATLRETEPAAVVAVSGDEEIPEPEPEPGPEVEGPVEEPVAAEIEPVATVEPEADEDSEPETSTSRKHGDGPELEVAEPGPEEQAVEAIKPADDDAGAAGAEDEPKFVIDSPHDATQYIPRDVVEASLNGSAEEPPPAFELADPAEMPEPVAEWESEEQATVPELLAGTVVDEPDDPEVSALLSETEDAGGSQGEQDESAGDVEISALLCPDDAEPAEAVEKTPAVDEPAAVEQPEDGPEVVHAGHGGNGNGDEGWQPPNDLEALITRFNAMQRVVYRSIRSEVGAGATNFVRSCGGRLERSFGEVFSKVDLHPDGAWDPGALRQVIVEHRVDRPWDGFQKLLDEEIDKLRIHIGEARATSLQERLEAIEV